VAKTETGSKRRVTVLGSTGSVGADTVSLIALEPEKYAVEALTARRNVKLLAEQAKRLKARRAVIADESLYGDLKDALAGSDIGAAAGVTAVIEAAEMPAEWVMSAIVGAAGLEPTLAAARRGATIALADKGCMVRAGPLMMELARKHGATLLPASGGQAAIFQCFDFERREGIARLILTASGGPFRTFDRAAMAGVALEQVVPRPTRETDAKTSVDNATMMTLGLEIIGAARLFDMPEEKIDALVHPQSAVHGLVEYVDGSVLTRFGSPDMRAPIAHALGWPKRLRSSAARLDLLTGASLTFHSPDMARFPAPRLARAALRAGGSGPILLNAANEVAVEAFLRQRIGFLDIERVLETTLAYLPNHVPRDIADIRAIEAMTHKFALRVVSLIPPIFMR